MSNPSTKQFVESLDSTVTSAGTRTILVGIAWLATLLMSKLPLVIARDILDIDIPWIMPAWVGTAALLFTASYVWQSLRPLRNYFLIMGVILLLAFGVDPMVQQTAFWQNLIVGQPVMVFYLAVRALLLLEMLIVLAVLFLMGMKRQDVYLTVGNLKAPVDGWASSSKWRFLSWPIIGTMAALLLSGLPFAFLVSQNPAWLSNIAVVLPWIPLILINAALNAFVEEVTYRAAPLRTLLPAVGPMQALWLTSLWFGLGHYFGGIPSGLAGLFWSGLVGLLMGKAMLETRGLGWPWIIHVAIDTVIYTFVTLAAIATL